MIAIKGQGKLAESYALFDSTTPHWWVPATITAQPSLTLNPDTGRRTATTIPTTPVVTSTVPAFTNQNTLTLSGTMAAGTSVLINGAVVVPLDNLTTWTASVNLNPLFPALRSVRRLFQGPSPQGQFPSSSGTTWTLPMTSRKSIEGIGAEEGRGTLRLMFQADGGLYLQRS